ncbi:accessory factor UbiK family protein [Leucothrix sargassi]|nr:accessory factor UbiK family protein [Leucothrix sargassi]
MDPIDQIDNLAKRLSSLIPEPLQATQQDIESNLRSGLESGLRKMNLVTREEFDVQNAVLLRTREKLEALEARISELEAQK